MENTSGNIQLNNLANRIVGLQVLVELDKGGNSDYRKQVLQATEIYCGGFVVEHYFNVKDLIKFAEEGRFKLISNNLILDLEGEDFASNFFDSKKLIIHRIDEIRCAGDENKDELNSVVKIKKLRKNFDPYMVNSTTNGLLYAISKAESVLSDPEHDLSDELALVNAAVSGSHSRPDVVIDPENVIVFFEETADYDEDCSEARTFNIKIDNQLKCLEDKVKVFFIKSSYDGEFNDEASEIICGSINDSEDLKELIFDNIVNPVMNLLSLIKKSNPGFHYSVKKND